MKCFYGTYFKDLFVTPLCLKLHDKKGQLGLLDGKFTGTYLTKHTYALPSCRRIIILTLCNVLLEHNMWSLFEQGPRDS